MERPVALVVAEAWVEALGVQPRKPDDDFFESGGDSMAAMTMVAHIESRIGVEVPVEVVFVEGTPRAIIAACVDAIRADEIH